MSSSPSIESKAEEMEAHKKGSEPTEKPAIPAEAGRAGWLCVVGSAIGLFCTFGFLAA